jgi:chromosome segregation ATPase
VARLVAQCEELRAELARQQQTIENLEKSHEIQLERMAQIQAELDETRLERAEVRRRLTGVRDPASEPQTLFTEPNGK